MNLPRLTGYLRVFSAVAGDVQSESEVNLKKQLEKKRKNFSHKRAEKGLTWSILSNTLHKNARDVSKEMLSSSLKNLLTATRDIVGQGNETDVYEAGAAYLFTVFHQSEKVGQNESKLLRQMFGPFPASAATKACSIVMVMASWLPDHILYELVSSDDAMQSDGSREFGEGVKFNFGDEQAEVSYDWLASEDEEEEDQTFDMKYIEEEMEMEEAAFGGLDSLWLRNQVDKYFGADNAADMCNVIFDTLSSPRSDTELQNELFELLGFDRFEFIQTLLENRHQLILGTTEAAKRDPKRAVKVPRSAPGRPNYGCQVIVQTEHQKQLMKQYRKEEKKMNKGRVEDEEEAQLKAMGFDPIQLRARREAALVSAASKASKASSISKGYREPPVTQTYPFVFDSYLEARQTSSFVAGAKLLLPDGFERKGDKLCEEVSIPPSAQAPTEIGHSLVPISQLDEIGQIAFKGMKSLNRIQSVVFETAYTNNENLLICAPTGAGKTNIAMLTIVHELKQHLSQGVIKKDEFKIVYVAPMKALAAEMVRNFGGCLEPLGITVKELTGDMQLTKAEIMKTQMLVTTPEKWDVVTRKSTGDVALTQIVRLLIIDEVHLLHDDRGAVIESLVARTLRQVESSQSMIRIVGLSATLPNYFDVARFLHVNPYSGLFFFDGRFRPVPLAQTFIGIKATNRMQQLNDFNTVCYEKALHQVRNGHQVMVFVHARNETVRTAMVLCEFAKNRGHIMTFQPEQNKKYGEALKTMSHSKNKQLRELFPDGFAVHHAGMLRQDRNLVERFFGEGHVKVLVCTATLAWGVNLPAHAVVIKGTQIYDAKKGAFVDLGILDVMQIFGRAGRPQFDTYGHGTILTTHDKLSHYLSLLTRQHPIESQFTQSLTDNLNAEISLGTVTNVEEAVKWLSYTYLFVRMRANPLVYGIPHQALQEDPGLEAHRRDLIISAARQLDKARMIRFEERTGYMFATDLGRTSSHFYIKYDTVEVFNEMFRSMMTEDKVFEMVSKSQEFEQIKVRDEELNELDRQLTENCVLPVAGGSENHYGKVNILLQSYISQERMDNFSLVSDQAYVAQNAARIVRALFEIALRTGWPIMAGRLLNLSKTIEKRLWGFENPLRQFTFLPPEIFRKLEDRRLTIDKLKEMEPNEIGHLVHHVRMGSKVKHCVDQIPMVNLDASIQPITRTVLRVRLSITPDFKWNDRVHGMGAEPFWIWVEDPDNNHIYHSEYFMMHKKHVQYGEVQQLVFTIPIFEPLPSQYYVRAISDRWLGSETVIPISFQHLILPEKHPPHTELLDLQPLPVAALNDPKLEALYSFTHFNPIQTQIFHTLYHTDCNVLLGAPTGSGKTVAAEMAFFRVFRESPHNKCVYIAPLKALVRERIEDWKVRIEQKLGKKVIELTGDVTPDMKAVANADLIVTTPEKWDGISRSWQTRSYVKAVTLLVIDEIHLLGDDRGPVLEVIVSRTNFISSHTNHKVRVVGLSTALANAKDLADWLGIQQMGLFNFRPSVRPVPLEVHIAGFPGKHYCPRMATMNKPAFQAVRTHSPAKPVLIFVSSRRQTRMTAIDLIAFLAAEDDPKQWLHMAEMEMENIISGIRDANLKLTLAFGIGLHHAGLHERDRKTAEELFVNSKIQILIATSTLAWGVNFPAHLVIIKGTEYYDGKTRRYVDFPITDVLQMMGRAGRPQFDDQGKAVILVHDIKKHFYKKFLYEPFPVESNLLEVMSDHLNAEIVAGTISSKQDCVDYLTWTYFFRRLLMNPSYYNLEDTDHEKINRFLSHLVEKSLLDLESSYCIELGEDGYALGPSTLGRIASYYYLHHTTVRMFRDDMTSEASIPDLIEVLSNAHEYAELPVRHNEDKINAELAPELPLEVNPHSFDSAHTKCHLLLQAHFCQHPLPSSDFMTDTKSVMDQAIRILQAMLDMSADQGWLVSTLRVIHLVQMVLQGRWIDDNTLLTLPHIQPYHLQCFRSPGGHGHILESLPEVIHVVQDKPDLLHRMLGDDLTSNKIDEVYDVLTRMPLIEVLMNIKGCWAGGQGEQKKPVVASKGGSLKDVKWIEVHADQEYVFTVDLRRINRSKRRDFKAHTPRYGKPKDEGWFLVMGNVESREVIALKRVGYMRGRTSTQLSFYTPVEPGRVIYTLYIMSDCYLGLDQQYDIHLEVIPSSIEAQVNMELTDDFDDLEIDE